MQPSQAHEPKATRTFDLRRISWAMYSCSLVRMPPLNRQTSMLPSGIFSTSRTLPSVAQGQKTMSKAAATSQDLVVDGQHGDFAAAAGGRPVDGQLALGFLAHGATSIASSCSLTISSHGLPDGRRPPASWPASCSGPSRRTSSTSLSIALGQPLPFGGRGPNQLHALGLDAHRPERVLEHGVAAHGLVVLLDVVALAGMAAGDHHAVGAVGQGLEDEGGIDPAAAHHADDADVGGVLDPRRAGQVGRPVRTPVAEEAHDFRFESSSDIDAQWSSGQWLVGQWFSGQWISVR